MNWDTEVKFVDGSTIKQVIFTTSHKSAVWAARNLATQQRPYLGTPVSVVATQSK